jgi:hypothetical protein
VPEKKPTNQTTMTAQLLTQALEALTCTGESDDPGHRCGHCDDYVDRNGHLRAAIRAHLEAQPEPDEDFEPMLRDIRRIELIEEIEWCLANGTMGHRTYTALGEARAMLEADLKRPEQVTDVLIDDVKFAVAPQVAAELLRLHLLLKSQALEAAPAQTAPQALTEDQVESLIDESDGRWHDGEFRIDGPDLTRLLRAAHGITAPKGTT